MPKMNCLYRLILGKPLKEYPPPSRNPILTVSLIMKPLPTTLEELSTLEQLIAKRMSSLNAMSYAFNDEISQQMKNTLQRKNSLKNDVEQLSMKLMEIQQKRDELIAARALH
jgi:hypothetical protein